jgi:UDP-galactopyranose mutase
MQIDLIDIRDHVAGNAYDEINEYGIRIHKYGPHLFHTSNMEVVSYLSSFTEWIDYQHKVKAMLSDGTLVTLPVNRETSNLVGTENIVDIFYRPYTKKMWGCDLEEIDSDVLKRVTVRDDLNELYFPNDSFQAMPKNGYTSMVENMLDHPNIKVMLKTGYDKSMESHYDHIFNSMSIDEYFEYRYGFLSYRSIKFHNHNLPISKIFPVATVNFTHNLPFTRVTEWTNIPGHKGVDGWTSITIEEPCDFKDNNYERYYPVKDVKGANKIMYDKYRSLVPENITFIGRCGLYAYFDMHQAVSSSMGLAKKFIKKI